MIFEQITLILHASVPLFIKKTKPDTHLWLTTEIIKWNGESSFCKVNCAVLMTE